MLYWAYGSNLSVRSMHRRCPAARKRERLILPNAKLVFRGVADVEHAEGSRCPGGLWEITAACERALDSYEGVRWEGARQAGLYGKEYLLLRYGGRERRCLFYVMRRGGIMPPGESYLGVIEEGYRDFGLDLGYLSEALNRSWGEKRTTPYLRQRHRKRGQRMAQPEPMFEEEDADDNV